MHKLKVYVEKGDWYQLYSEGERGHLLTFYYNLVIWLERDNADELILKSTEILWKRQNQEVGRFPITTPEPSPSFRDMLLLIIQRDNVIKQYIISNENSESVFQIERNQEFE